ncbi:hypothetical protein [Sellimonas sp.]|uniref:hypothetical protein n=1 Tax=Sellimonas sp. TaxID=2021466 RepID=UPI00258004D8|nr:hypothetical protein [Sellimonas sp.]
MIIGFLTIGKDSRSCILSALNGKDQSVIMPGQYLYVNVSNGWIPVELKYSDRIGRYYFSHLPELPVNGRMAMVKS